MSLYSSIDRRINADEWFRGLSEGAQLLWFRLLTGSHVTALPGLWAATEDGLARAFRLPLERFRERFAELSRDCSSSGLPRVIADWEAGVIWLPNALQFPCNEPKNPNALAGWKTHLELMPECDLKDQALQHFAEWVNARKKRFSKGWPYGSVNRSRNRSGNGSGNPPPVVPPQEQEQKQEQERSDARASDAVERLPPAAPVRADLRRFADSFVQPGDVEREVFACWAAAFMPAAAFDAGRASCLLERARAGMTKQDGEDAVAGALADEWINGTKDGKMKRKLSAVFGTADSYEGFREAGKALRERPSGILRKAPSVAERQAADARAEVERRLAKGLPALKEAAPVDLAALDALVAQVGRIG